MKDASTDAAICPFCGSGETELMSLFGQQLLTVQYYCLQCHTPFERVKGDEDFDAAESQMRRTARDSSSGDDATKTRLG